MVMPELADSRYLILFNILFFVLCDLDHLSARDVRANSFESGFLGTLGNVIRTIAQE